MTCPFCSRELKEVKFKEHLIDICPHCKGVWLDSGEIADFVKTLTESEEISPKMPQLFKPRIICKADTVKEKDRICPKCNQKLQKFNYAYDSNVFLDKCPQCEGIWADGGELVEIARHLKQDPRVTAIMKEYTQKDRALEDLAGLGKSLMQPASPIMLLMPKIIIPLSDDNPRQRTPLITISIIILCILVFIGEIFSATIVADPRSFLQKFALIPAHFFSIGLISSMFLHGSPIHLLGNMFFLWLFGDNVEDRFSHLGFLIFYLCCGLAASILHGLLNWGSLIPAIGASGAISGVMGAYFVFYPKARIKLLFIYKIFYIPAFLYLGAWFLFQLMFSAIDKASGASNIAWFAHIGGFAFGGIVAYFKRKQFL